MKRFEKMDAKELIRMCDYHKPKDPVKEARRAQMLRANIIELKKIKLPTPVKESSEARSKDSTPKLIINPPVSKHRRWFTSSKLHCNEILAKPHEILILRK